MKEVPNKLAQRWAGLWPAQALPITDPRLEGRQRSAPPANLLKWAMLGATALSATAAAAYALRGGSSLVAPGLGTHAALTPARQPHVRCVDQDGSPACRAAIIPPQPMDSYLAICMMVRDDPDFPEWITHHRRLGVGSFYVYDHNSTIALPDRMPDDSLQRGDVHYEYINQFPIATDVCPQMAVLHECLEVAAHHPWVAFIDVDEYLVPAPGQLYLPDFMRQFEGACALILNWRQCGSNGHEARPAGGVVESYTKCLARDHYFNWWTKVVVHPSLVVDFSYLNGAGFQGPHAVQCRNDTHMLTESQQIYGTPEVFPVQADKLSVYHYATRSLEDYQARISKGASSGDVRQMRHFEEINQASTEDTFGARDLVRQLG